MKSHNTFNKTNVSFPARGSTAVFGLPYLVLPYPFSDTYSPVIAQSMTGYIIIQYFVFVKVKNSIF